ncbi:MAG TPA: serine/threonine-protein kinase [Anaeromyxobacteraceae bacterium]|nr:serine/threonine-protein kinase [Anaeromyxobacteraceae bacterium]
MRELEVGDALDGYELIEQLGRGGMATVYKAVDVGSGQVVALKIPHLQYECDIVFHERFRREEAAARGLDHPNVVRALPPRAEPGRMYMVMEYVEGTPLAALLHEGRAVPVAQAVDIARQACEAIAYLHARGIVHRDVKPGNVLLTSTGQVKLLDLGIAHHQGARRLTLTGLAASFGTPDYMAPEQAAGRVGDARVDVYAVGAMLYQMLSGRLPYASEDWEARLRAKRLEAPLPLSRHVPGVDPALEAIVMKAIAPRPEDRHGTAVDLLAELRDPSAAVARAARAGALLRPPRDLRPVAAAVTVAAALGLVGWIGWLSHERMVEGAAARASGAPAGVVAGASGPAADARRR